MKAWQVAGAIIERDGSVLLVENLRRNGSTDWTPPGGVVEVADGESILDGLAREVAEETSLVVTRWADQPLYRVQVEAPELGWVMRVEVHLAIDWTGEVTCGDDPDGIVIGAEYCSPDLVIERTARGHPWVHHPLTEWVDQRWTDVSDYRYRVDGDRIGHTTAVRLD